MSDLSLRTEMPVLTVYCSWVVVQANCYAREHGLRQFSVYQGRWSAAERDFEREIIPMCRSEGMSLAPWGALGGGKSTYSRLPTLGLTVLGYFKAPDEGQKQDGRTLAVNTGKEGSVSVALDRVAKRKAAAITSVALAYVMHKCQYRAWMSCFVLETPVVLTRSQHRTCSRLSAAERPLNSKAILKPSDCNSLKKTSTRSKPATISKLVSRITSSEEQIERRTVQKMSCSPSEWVILTT